MLILHKNPHPPAEMIYYCISRSPKVKGQQVLAVPLDVKNVNEKGDLATLSDTMSKFFSPTEAVL